MTDKAVQISITLMVEGHTYEYLPVYSGNTNPLISSNLTVEYAVVLHASIPLFKGPE